MKSLERNMSRNLARLKYSTPAVLVAVACIAAPSLAMAGGPRIRNGSRCIGDGPSRENRSDSTSRTRGTVGADAVSERSPGGRRAGRSEIGAVGPIDLCERCAVGTVTICGPRQGGSNEHVAGGLGARHTIGASSHAAHHADQLSGSIGGSLSVGAGSPAGCRTNQLSSSIGSLAIGTRSPAGCRANELGPMAAAASQSAPARMQLASLDSSVATEVQTVLVKPNFSAASQSASHAIKASQGANAAKKSSKVSRASYSASKAASFAAKVQSARAPKASSLKVKSASK